MEVFQKLEGGGDGGEKTEEQCETISDGRFLWSAYT